MRGPDRLFRSIARLVPQSGMRLQALLTALLITGCLRTVDQVTGDPSPGGNRPAAVLSVAADFSETTIASGLSFPTAMQFAPDGRLFVCQQAGQLRVIKNGALLPAPFLTVTTTSNGERGLLGVAIDPDFADTRHVFIYYTATSPALHNRLSRFTASATNPDVAEAGSETVLLELDNLGGAIYHNGGALNFGPDGRLYIAVGENANGANSQTLANLLGKMLRLNKDGSIPADNPFYGTASGKNRAIWALGLRNPFTFAFQPGTGRLFINDVGQDTWEEIDEGQAGANFGWPATEGPTADPRFKTPFHAYGHGEGCAVTGGAFYNPSTPRFPAEYVGDYFFADYCGGWIRRIDPDTKAVSGFATGLPNPIDLKVGPDGALYYLGIGQGSGTIRKITWSGSQAPTITAHPAGRTVPVGGSAAFTVSASGASPLSYRWQRNGTDISGATAATYTLASAQAADSGARFRAIVANAYGSATSDEAVLAVTSNRVPDAVIAAPAAGTLFSGGDVIAYSGSGSDPEDGALPASAMTWQVDLHHEVHTHPYMLPATGSASGTFTIPTRGETSPDIWYRLHLTVRDAGGLTHQVYRDIHPRKATVTLATTPAGLQLRLDGRPVTAPHTFTGVAGIIRSLEAVTPQASGGRNWRFASWSDGGAALHEISTPSADTTYAAAYQEDTVNNVYQAEDGVLHNAVVASTHTGYTGTGYVTYLGSSGSYVEWTVNVATAGIRRLEFRYALSSGSRPLVIRVNGTPVTSGTPFPGTGTWSTWGVVGLNANMPAGTSRVSATSAGWGGPNVDCLTVR